MAIGLWHDDVESDRNRSALLDLSDKLRKQGARPRPLAIFFERFFVDIDDDDRLCIYDPRFRRLNPIEQRRIAAVQAKGEAEENGEGERREGEPSVVKSSHGCATVGGKPVAMEVRGALRVRPKPHRLSLLTSSRCG